MTTTTTSTTTTMTTMTTTTIWWFYVGDERERDYERHTKTNSEPKTQSIFHWIKLLVYPPVSLFVRFIYLYTYIYNRLLYEEKEGIKRRINIVDYYHETFVIYVFVCVCVFLARPLSSHFNVLSSPLSRGNKYLFININIVLPELPLSLSLPPRKQVKYETRTTETHKIKQTLQISKQSKTLSRMNSIFKRIF